MLRGLIVGRLTVQHLGKPPRDRWTSKAVAGVDNKSRLNFIASIYGDEPPRLKVAPEFSDVEFPPDRRKLRLLEKAPVPPPGQRAPKMTKRLIDIRGPELVHNKLIHKQYGIRANQGGQLKYGHIEMVRLGINRKLIESRMFAIWRIDSPWKPITKKGQGHRMGGGKGSIDHYVTPVKSGRIIIEVGGLCEYQEVYLFLKQVAAKLPFKAEPISQAMLEEEAAEEEYTQANNINPFSFEYCIHRNFLGCRTWAGQYDYIWHGKHR